MLDLTQAVQELQQQLEQVTTIHDSLDTLGSYPLPQAVLDTLQTATDTYEHYRNCLVRSLQELQLLLAAGYPTLPTLDVPWTVFLPSLAAAQHIEAAVKQVLAPLIAQSAVITPGTPHENS